MCRGMPIASSSASIFRIVSRFAFVEGPSGTARHAEREYFPVSGRITSWLLFSKNLCDRRHNLYQKKIQQSSGSVENTFGNSCYCILTHDKIFLQILAHFRVNLVPYIFPGFLDPDYFFIIESFHSPADCGYR